MASPCLRLPCHEPTVRMHADSNACRSSKQPSLEGGCKSLALSCVCVPPGKRRGGNSQEAFHVLLSFGTFFCWPCFPAGLLASV
eukprot:362004-Chlamydomonas_euryale.AAC.8